MIDLIKLSSPATQEFWEISILFEDAHLLALNKPARLLTSPDRVDPERPTLIQLLHRDIKRGAPWTRARGLLYLMNAHRLDFETSGVLLFAKNKPALVALADLFGSEKPLATYAALVRGVPAESAFSVEARLAPHPVQAGLTRIDEKLGKRSRTDFSVRERFSGYALLECHPRTNRLHQIRAHLRHFGLPVVGDRAYGGKPLLLSSLKSAYRLKPNKTERPLIASAALHFEELAFLHPVTKVEVKISAPWSKDMTLGLKYLRRYGAVPNTGSMQ